MNLINELDQAVLEHAKKSWHDHQPKKGHSVTDYVPSGNSYEGTCLRAQAYAWMGVEPLWDMLEPKRLYAPAFGDYVENFLVDMLTKHRGWTAERQKKIELSVMELHYPIHGRIDDILTKNGNKIVAEFKSCHGRKFNSKQFGIMYVGPDAAHLNQLGMYRACLEGNIKNTKIDVLPMEGYEYHLVYFSREDFNRKPFVDGESMTLTTDFQWEWWMRLEDYLDKKVLPPRNFKSNPDKGREDFPCAWCRQVNNCWDVHDKI